MAPRHTPVAPPTRPCCLCCWIRGPRGGSEERGRQKCTATHPMTHHHAPGRSKVVESPPGGREIVCLLLLTPCHQTAHHASHHAISTTHHAIKRHAVPNPTLPPTRASKLYAPPPHTHQAVHRPSNGTHEHLGGVAQHGEVGIGRLSHNNQALASYGTSQQNKRVSCGLPRFSWGVPTHAVIDAMWVSWLSWYGY